MKHLLILIMYIMLVNAEEINLTPGTQYISNDNTTIKCTQANIASNINITNNSLVEIETNCQYYDEHNAECMYEQTIYKYNGRTCVDKCGYWDNFHEECLYKNTCKYNKQTGTMKMKKCNNYDEQYQKCNKESKSTTYVKSGK